MMRGFWLLIHIGIIISLIIQVTYSGYQVFVTLQPAGVEGPMGAAAVSLPFEAMVVRRLYALEGWVAFIGLAVYLAITEIYPRLRG